MIKSIPFKASSQAQAESYMRGVMAACGATDIRPVKSGMKSGNLGQWFDDLLQNWGIDGAAQESILKLFEDAQTGMTAWMDKGLLVLERASKEVVAVATWVAISAGLILLIAAGIWWVTS